MKTADFKRLKDGSYEIRLYGMMVGWLYKEYHKAVGDSGYVGHVPGYYAWQFDPDDGEPYVAFGKHYFRFDTFAEAKQWLRTDGLRMWEQR